jgi:serine/threonine protein kinase
VENFLFFSLSLGQVDTIRTVQGRLKHPGIVGILKTVQTPKCLAIVYELVSGGELFKKIIKQKRFSEQDTKGILLEVLETLHYLHSQGIVHGDIKPEVGSGTWIFVIFDWNNCFFLL